MIDRVLLAVDDSPASLADQRLVAIGEVPHVDRRCRPHSGQSGIRRNWPVRSGGGAHRIDRTSRGRYARGSNGLSP
jgi:hypothetical protein